MDLLEASLLALLVSMIGCGGTEIEGGPEPPPCEGVVDDQGDCVAAGVQDDGCLAGELGTDDGCEPAGVTEAWCAEGFSFDPEAYSCEPILPAAPCPPGQMALPGETSCRAVMECPDERWGGIPADATTQYVDAAYGGLSTGSTSQPWTTLAEATAAAEPGAVIAIEAGEYAESLVLGKSLKLWGVCPERVVIAPSSDQPGFAFAGSSGVEVRGVAVSGGLVGVVITAADVLLESVWVRDASDRGIGAEDTLGPASLTVRDSLVEGCGRGVVSLGGTLVLDGVVVRDTPASAGETSGRAIEIGVGEPPAPSTGTLERVVVRGAGDFGLYVLGAEAVAEGLVVTGMLPREDEIVAGAAVGVKDDAGFRGTLELRSSALFDNASVGVFVQAAGVVLEGVSIRDHYGPALESGRGINAVAGQTGERATVVARSTTILRSHEIGVAAGGADVGLSGVRVVDTSRDEQDEEYGGQGVGVYRDVFTGQRGALSIVGSRIVNNLDHGVVVIGADLTLRGTVVGGTQPNAAGLFGDAVAVVQESSDLPSTALVEASVLNDNERGGLTVFAASATMGRTHLSCNEIDIATETFNGVPADFTNAGENVCGCENATPCKALSAGLVPPEALQ